jgi:hypothetical protein
MHPFNNPRQLLTTLHNVVLAAAVNYWLIVATAAQAYPACTALDAACSAGSLLALGYGAQAAIAVGESIFL